MDMLSACINSIDNFIWGPYLLIPLLLGTGAYLMIGLRFMPLRRIPMAFRVMWQGRKHSDEEEGELSPFNALMTSMAATVGTGNIVGVATAILGGGPGALFWMWCTAFVGMATKFCEATLAVKYREVTPSGSYVGGPMYYIRKGLGEKWAWLATSFAVFGAIASFGIGNMTQGNAIANNIAGVFGVPPVYTAILLFVLIGVVLLGGVKRIGFVAGKLVPFMALFYILLGILICALNWQKIPHVFELIFTHAFTPISAAGGFAGAAVQKAIQLGVSRGLFSNEAGMGSAPIAHATAITKHPVRQGFLGMLDPFLDTIVICTITGVVILISGQWLEEMPRSEAAATLTSMAFGSVLPGIGQYAVTIGIVLFAFTTILGWSVYGERCTIYLFGHRAAAPFRFVFTLVIPLGALAKLDLVWDLANIFNGMMALPNLIALLLLSPVVFKMSREYFAERDLNRERKALLEKTVRTKTENN